VAVDDLSFEIERGDVVGFLGPNGAGKTTTIRILCGFLAASSGDVEVAGRRVHEEPLEARRHIGYLPERCPLYPEMRVDEFLRFRAALKGVPATRVRRRVDEVKEQCGLTEVGRRIIGQLSKGFCQRVGLADALIHEPELLILDEPTIGLDPAQIRQVRDLIRDLSTRHTILLSTHILSEVEAVCRRVLILHQGRLVAADTTERLRQLRLGAQRITAELMGDAEGIRTVLSTLPGVSAVAVEPNGAWVRASLLCECDADPRSELARRMAERGWALRELRLEETPLEDIFIALTAAGEARNHHGRGGTQ